MTYRVGIDIGGTFTDITVADEEDGAIEVYKALSDREDPLQGILSGIALACQELGCSEEAFISPL